MSDDEITVCESLNEAAELVIIEMIGSDHVKEWLIGDNRTSTERIRATIAFHTYQSCMWFAEKESGDSKEDILASWDRNIDPRMSYAWRMLQSYWWCP